MASCGDLPTACFFFSSRRRHTRLSGDWSSDVCSSDLSDLAADLGVEVRGAGAGRLAGHSEAVAQDEHAEGEQTERAAVRAGALHHPGRFGRSEVPLAGDVRLDVGRRDTRRELALGDDLLLDGAVVGARGLDVEYGWAPERVELDVGAHHAPDRKSPRIRARVLSSSFTKSSYGICATFFASSVPPAASWFSPALFRLGGCLPATSALRLTAAVLRWTALSACSAISSTCSFDTRGCTLVASACCRLLGVPMT